MTQLQQLPLILRQLGIRPYIQVSNAMHWFTEQRSAQTADEVWLVQHPPTFTQGQAGKAEHILAPGDIPVIQSDRGGQITYHGPGQQIMYVLIDLKRLRLGVRELVTHLENTVIMTLSQSGITAIARPEAPGVYAGEQKICSLGLRIRKGCSLHGLALNVHMDITPFTRINPCGFAGMPMTQVCDLVPGVTLEQISLALVQNFIHLLGYLTTEHHPWNVYDYE